MTWLVVVTALVAPSAQSSCRIDICSYESRDCCTPMGEARSCDVPGYLVADGGPSWCTEIFGESAAYQCCREETEESGSGVDAQPCPITRESCYNDPVPGDCSWICGDIFSRFSEFKGMDLDSDGVVTIEEIEEVNYHWVSPAEAKEMAQREMRPMDRDGDNALSEEEFMHSPEFQDGFTWAMDLNGDGVVTTEEIEEAQSAAYRMSYGSLVNPAHIKEWAEREMQWVDRDGDNAISKEDCPINREFCENDPLLPDDCSCGRVDEGHGHVYCDSAVADCGYRACGYCDCAFEKYYGDGRCCTYEDDSNMEPSAEDIRKWTDRDLNGDGVATMEEIEEMHNHANDWDWMPSPADEVKCSASRRPSALPSAWRAARAQASRQAERAQGSWKAKRAQTSSASSSAPPSAASPPSSWPSPSRSSSSAAAARRRRLRHPRRRCPRRKVLRCRWLSRRLRPSKLTSTRRPRRRRRPVRDGTGGK